MIEREGMGVAVVFGVSQHVVTGATNASVSLHEVIYIVLDDQEKKRGQRRVQAEIVRIQHDTFDAIVFGDTSDIRVGQTIELSRTLVTIPLGPGLLGSLVDGHLNFLASLDVLHGQNWSQKVDKKIGDEQISYLFTPKANLNHVVQAGDLLGVVSEGPIEHKIMVPFTLSGRYQVIAIASEKLAHPRDVMACLMHVDNKTTHEITLTQYCCPRNALLATQKRAVPDSSLNTKLRGVDVMMPIAKGGAACVIAPARMNSMIAHHLVCHVDADVVVYVTSGNCALVLSELFFAFNNTPGKGAPSFRTVVITNAASDLASQELSLHSGATIAEYYQRMGLDVVLVADGISGFSDALQTINDQLGEPIDDDGLPLDFKTRMARFFERASYEVHTEHDRRGSLTIIGCASSSLWSIESPSMKAIRAACSSVLYANSACEFTSEKAVILRHSSPPSINLLAPIYREAFEKAQGTPEQLYRFYEQGLDLLRKVNLLGDECLSVPEYIHACKVKMFDEVFLRQDSWSVHDSAPSETRIASQLKHVLALMHFDFSFTSTQTAQEFFATLTSMMRALNRMSTREQQFESHLRRISELVVHHHTPFSSEAMRNQL